jgi:hypothetical protein
VDATDPKNPIFVYVYPPTSTGVAQVVPLVNRVKNLTVLYG